MFDTPTTPQVIADRNRREASSRFDERAAGDPIDLTTAAAPRSHDSHDDLSYDDVTAAPRSRDCHHDMSSELAGIEGRIEEIEREIVALAPVIEERARLLRAKALILGEPEPPPRAIFAAACHER
jgi:hypothetical protein